MSAFGLTFFVKHGPSPLLKLVEVEVGLGEVDSAISFHLLNLAAHIIELWFSKVHMSNDSKRNTSQCIA